MNKIIKLLVVIFTTLLVGLVTTSLVTNNKNKLGSSQLHRKSNQVKDNQNVFKQINSIPLKTRVNQIFQDTTGNLWIGAYNGLWEQPKDKIAFTQISSIPSDDSVTQFLQDTNGNLWVNGDQLWEQPKGVNWFTHVRDGGFELLQDTTGNFWYGINGLGLWEKPKDKHAFTRSNSLPNDVEEVEHIFQDTTGNLWITTEDKGLWEQPKDKNLFKPIHSIPIDNTNFNQIFQDTIGGNLWIGTNEGLWKQAEGQTAFTQIGPFSNDTNVKQIFQDTTGNLLIVAGKGSLWEQPKDKKGFTKISSWPDDVPAKQIFQDTTGNLWITTNNYGLWEQKDGQKTFEQSNSLEYDIKVNQIFQDEQKNIWIGADGNGLWEKISTGILITSTANSPTYDGTETISGKQQQVSFFRDPFSIKVNGQDVNSIEVGKVTCTGIDFGKPLNFPNKTYGIAANQTFRFKAIYKESNKQPYVKYFCIKTQYLDNGNGAKDNLTNALTSTGGKGIRNTNQYLKGDHKKVKYQLFSDLSIDKATNPILKIIPKDFNFLTNYSESSYAPITIVNGVITKGNSTPLGAALLPSHPITIAGTNTNNLYEVDLVDHLRNKQMFLIQVGGAKLNANFTTNDHNRKYIVGIGVTVALIAVMLLSAAVLYRRIWRPAHQLHLFTKKPIKFNRITNPKTDKLTLVRRKKPRLLGKAKATPKRNKRNLY